MLTSATGPSLICLAAHAPRGSTLLPGAKGDTSVCSRPALQCSRAPCCHGPSQRPLGFLQHLLPCTALVPAVVGAAVSHSVPLAINFLVAGQGSIFGPCKHIASLIDWQKASPSTSGLDITAGATR